MAEDAFESVHFTRFAAPGEAPAGVILASVNFAVGAGHARDEPDGRPQTVAPTGRSYERFAP